MAPSRSDSKDSRVEAMFARIASLESDPEKALEQLGTSDDPESVLRRLQILIESERFQDASRSVSGLEPDERWCDKAILAHALVGNLKAVRQLLGWSERLPKHEIRQRCALQFAEGMQHRIAGNHPSPLQPSHISPEEQQELREVLNALSRITAFVESQGHIEYRLQQEGVEAATRIAWLLGDRDACQRLATFLRDEQSLSRLYVQLVLDGAIEPKENLPERIRREYSRESRMLLIALRIESEILGEKSEAFNNAMKLAQGIEQPAGSDGLSVAPECESSNMSVFTLEQQKTLFWFLWELAEGLDQRARSEVGVLAPRLLHEEDPSREIHKAIEFLHSKAPAEAAEELRSVEDPNNFLWLQANARRCLQQGDGEQAARDLLKASKILGNDEKVLRWTCTVAFKYDQLDIAKEALTLLLDADQDDVNAIRNMGVVLSVQQEYLQAAECFERIMDTHEDCVYEAVRLYALGGSLQRAFSLVDELGQAAHPAFRAVFWCSELLKRLGQTEKSFTYLDDLRAAFWDNPEFVQHYMMMAYAAAEDRKAGEALGQLMAFRKAGNLPTHALEEKKLEDLAELIQEENTRRAEFFEGIVGGQAFPWLTAERALGKASLWAWRERTQTLRWINEAPQTRGAYTIYATNGFHAMGPAEGPKQLESIKCPPKDTIVAADLTALLTLSRLGLLAKVGNYFEKILVPNDYLPLAFEEQDKLALHQPSRWEAVKEFRRCLDAGQLHMVCEGASQGDEAPLRVDEYDNSPSEGSSVIRLRQVAMALHEGGHISDELLKRAQEGLRDVGDSEEGGLQLEPGMLLLVELTTLGTIFSYGMLEPFVSNFVVHVSAEDKKQIILTDLNFTAQVETGRWHEQLWSHVRDSESYVLSRHAHGVEDGETDRDSSLAAFRLSMEKHIPLLADDRVFQAAKQNEESSSECMAFGVDIVLAGMYEAGTLTIEEMTRHYCQLMEWRYRFLLPPVDVLMECARQYKGNPPGDRLRRIAAYLHECMHDPGLLTGLEQTTPQKSIAAHFVTELTTQVARFVIEIWKDEAFSVESSELLTQWAGKELLPSVSHRMGMQGFKASQTENQGVVVFASLYSTQLENSSRAEKGLRCLVETLGMSEEDFLDVATGSLRHSYVDADPKDETLFAKVLMRNVSGENMLLHRRHVLMCKLKGLLESFELLPLDVPATEALGPEGESESPRSVEGPLLFVLKDGGGAEAFSIADALLNEDQEQRALVLPYLRLLEGKGEKMLCPMTQERLDAGEAALQSGARREWTLEAIELYGLLREDFLLNLAGMRQSLDRNYQEGLNEYMAALLTPTLQGLNGLPIQVARPTEHRAAIVEHIGNLVEEFDSLEKVLDGYFEYCGHLPLDGECSLGGLIGLWRAKRGAEEGIANLLWAWADGKESPLAGYHVCQALCSHSDLLDESTLGRFWDEMRLVILAGEEDGGVESPHTNAWKLRCKLAQHYCKHIESLNWSSEGEAFAAIAWWLAEKVSSLFAGPADGARQVLEYLGRSEVPRTSEMWLLVRPVVQPSLLRYVTLNVRSPWGLAAFGQIEKLGKEHLRKVPDADWDAMTRALCGNLWCACSFSDDQSKPLFAFDGRNVLEGAEVWAEVDKDDHRTQLTRVLRDAALKLSNQETLFDALQKTEGLNEADWMLVVYGLRSLISVEKGALERVDALFAKRDWLERLLLTLSTQTIELLHGAIAELVGQCQLAGHERKSWFYELPHTFATACEKSVEDDERRPLLFAMTTLLCLQSDTASALHRLVGASNRAKFREEIEVWRTRLEDARRRAPSALAAKIRPILCVLSQ